MEFQSFGEPSAPALFLLPPAGAEAAAFLSALRPLEKTYFLVYPSPRAIPPEELTARAEECIRRDFSGRVWGVYGLREGAGAALTLLARGRVHVRTAIAEGPCALPEGKLEGTRTRVYFWLGSRDREAKKTCEALRGLLPSLHTLTLRKLRKGESFLSLRPDLALRRLEKTLGKARLVRVSSVTDRNADRSWALLRRSPAEAWDARLKKQEPVFRDAENRTLIREGSGGPVLHWSHMVHLEPLSQTETLRTDEVEMAAGLLTSPLRLLTTLSLQRSHRRWARLLREDRQKAWLDEDA